MKKAITILIIGILLTLSWGGIRAYKGWEFTVGCGGHLKRAANANTIDLATIEMQTAVKYAEQKGLTTGYTSVFYRTPDEEVDFWYQNIKSAHEELKAVSKDATQLEKSNVLMKLRETLVDQGEKSSSVTMPDGISVYPNNLLYFIWGWLGLILFSSALLYLRCKEL